MLNPPAAPFHDDAALTAFLTQFIQDSNHLGQTATTIAKDGFYGDIAGLVQQIPHAIAATPNNAAVIDADDDPAAAAHGGEAAAAAHAIAATPNNAAVIDADDAPAAAAHGGEAAAAAHAAAVSDIAALLQALQENDSKAVNDADFALGNDVHSVTTADPGSHPSFTHQFEHIWG